MRKFSPPVRKSLTFSGEFDDNEVTHKIEQEHAKYSDILQESFMDSYNNLTIKSIYILKYYIRNAAKFKIDYLLKTDDDSFINLEALLDSAKYRKKKYLNHLVGHLVSTINL